MSDAMAFPRWEFDPGALEALVEEEGFDDPADFERACRIREGRIAEYADNGWQPFIWEFRRMALVLDMDMDELFDETFPAQAWG